MKKMMIEPKDRVKDFVGIQLPEGFSRSQMRNGMGRKIGEQERMLYKVNGKLILEFVTYPGTRIDRKTYILIDKLGRVFEEAAFEAFTQFIQHGFDTIVEE